MSDKILNFTEALLELESISKEKFTLNVWIPSQKKEFKIKEINIKQQKSLLESFLGSLSYKSTFSKVFFEIIKENWLEDLEILNQLTIVDKAMLAFYNRYNLSNEFEINLEDGKLNVDLSVIIDKLKQYSHPENKKISHTNNGITVEVETCVPIFKQQAEIEDYIFNNIQIDDEENLVKQITSNSFICDFASYIKEIKIDDDSFGYNSLTIEEKIRLVENLPAALVKQVFDEIFTIKTSLEDLCTVKDGNLSKFIEINGALFM